jgi:oxygen-independent coproporphyrinogen III oxidase
MNADSFGSGSEPMPHQTGLYVHVPFCLRKCAYCSFFSLAVDAGSIALWQRALACQIEHEAPDWAEHRFATLFFGGGTPSVIGADRLISILNHCQEAYTWRDEVEVSLEANPATVARGDLIRLRRAGFNRLSIGVQSFNQQELQRLGRPHTGGQAEDLVKNGRRAGFDNLSLDLMFGLPGQDVRSWQENLDRALALQPDHLSIYELTIEPQTPLALLQQQGRLTLPDEEVLLEMMARTQASLGALERYEISNYAKPGFACRHNLNYWQNGTYLGLGPAAVTYGSGCRKAAVAELPRYCERALQGQPVWDSSERLGHEAAFRETVVMGLRMVAGVEVDRLRQRFGIELTDYYDQELPLLLQQGLLSLDGTPRRLRLTTRGLALANAVMAELV